MTSFITTYTMKATDIPWLVAIPEHWKLCRAKEIFHPIDIRSVDGSEEILTVSSTLGIVPRKFANVTMFEAASYEGYKLCWPGDLVINSLWAWAFALGVSQYHGVVSTAYGVYRLLPGLQVDLQFIHLLLRSVPFQWELQTRSKGIWISRLQLTDESFLDAPLPLPTFEEQISIAKYLDYADQIVRGGVSQKLELVELMEEYKRAVIQQAVTRGLDLDVPLKPSGVEWLGDIPEHWEVRRLRTLARIINGATPSTQDPLNWDGDIEWLTPDDLGKLRTRYVHKGSRSMTLKGYESCGATLAPAGSLAISTRAPIGHIGILRQEACVNQGCRLLTPKNLVESAWLYFSLRAFNDELSSLGQGSTFTELSRDKLGGFAIALPPLTEQTAIVAHLDKLTSDIDAAIAHTRREIEFLEEYRTRLIADAVTGKLDVREAAANLPDVNLGDLQPLVEGGEAAD